MHMVKLTNFLTHDLVLFLAYLRLEKIHAMIVSLLRINMYILCYSCTVEETYSKLLNKLAKSISNSTHAG